MTSRDGAGAPPQDGAADQRLLLVHAHPDDETINNGATMARYVAEGRGVTVVTCTAGEMGEVLVPDLEHLAYEKDGGLGERRKGEIADAMAALGVTDHRWLGGFGRFHDSGMAWHADGHAVAGEFVPDNALLERRPPRGRRRAGPDHPRGPSAGAGHLRRVRRLRPPRPHPGAPRRDVRHRARGGVRVQARPRRAARRRQGLLVRDEREPDAREPAADARGGRHHQLRGHGPRRGPRPVRHRRRPDLGPHRRPGVRRAEDGRPQACTAPRSTPTGRSSPAPSPATRSGATSTTCWPRAPGARWARTASRPTSSPGSEPVAASS